jgi:hypothetical protein
MAACASNQRVPCSDSTESSRAKVVNAAVVTDAGNDGSVEHQGSPEAAAAARNEAPSVVNEKLTAANAPRTPSIQGLAFDRGHQEEVAEQQSISGSSDGSGDDS